MTTDTEILARQAARGWLLPWLLVLDCAALTTDDARPLPHRERALLPLPFTGWHRWDYWLWILEHNTLPPEPIPRVPFENQPDVRDAKAIQTALDYALRQHGGWYDEAWMKLVKWLLHGFGRAGLADDVAGIPEDVRVWWYQHFNLAHLLHSPCDWSAFVLQGGLQDDRRTRSPWSRSTGFYSTPLEICALMAEMNLATYDRLIDTRLLTVCDPCVGTGSMLLPASNYSLRLYGQDIVYDLCLCAELNGWLWMPWLVKMPTATETYLQAQAARMTLVQQMRAILTGDARPAPLAADVGATGIQHDDSRDTHRLAEQRRASAEAFWAAARQGALAQPVLFDL